MSQGATHRSALPPERAYLFAGGVAIALAVALLVLPMTSASVAIPVIGLFAAALGYLRIRGGLALGSLHLARFYSPS